MHATALNRMISNHRAIILQHSDMDFGPTPFKLFNSWLQTPDFDDVIRNAWENFQCKDGSNTQIMFKEKMKHLKNIIKVWANNFNASKGIEKELLMQSIADAESILEAGGGDQGIVNRKRRQLAINGIMKEGCWITNPKDIKGVFLEFFHRILSRFEGIKVARRSESYKSLSIHQSSFLEEPVSEIEIKKAIWDCGSDKSPGPDGFTLAFYKRYWSTLKNDIMAYVRGFFDSSNIPSGCNSSFITLIPKVANPLVASDFRQISLIGAQYKVIAKILANRLSWVIATVISNKQTTFVSQRQILDGPLMVNEIIDWYKQKKERLMILKIDFEKAFDSVSWDFLDQVLHFTGFGHTWRSWIRGCLSSAKASVLVNGSPTIEFNLQRGLKLNLHKSNLYGVGVDLTEVSNLALVTGCQAKCLHFSYLGLPVGSNMARINSWVPIVDKFFWGSTEEATKIPWIAWKSVIAPKSQGGLGIGSLNAFNLALIQKWRWRFAHEQDSLWTRVIIDIHGHPGDLGSCFFSQCRGSSVWARIVKSINSLNERGIIPFSTLKRKVNDGTGTRFWRDAWICDIPLANKYPRLFRLDLNQDCFVSEKWNGEWIWSWSRPINGGTTGSHFEELQNLVSNVQLKEDIDEWQWNLNSEKTFTVKHTRLHIDHLTLPSEAPLPVGVNLIQEK
ncbi:RNA-directed DNA polymerase, eukaryota [Tanacetum coccineum]